MADSKDPFANINLVDDKPQATDTPATQPLTNKDRLIASALFDTQPKRRAEFLAEKGWEMNPKDTNEMRPVGSQGPYSVKLDPGGYFDVSQYLSKKYGSVLGGTAKDSKAGLSELGMDAGEGLLDMIQGALIEGAGQVTGAAVGAGGALSTAPAGGVGAIPAYVAGRAIGRSTAYNLLEHGKEMLGDMFLDKDVPPDMREKLMQTAIQAVGPEAVQPAFATAGKAIQSTLGAVKKGFINLVTMGGGKVDDVALKGLASNPHLFSSANLEQGGSIVQNEVHNLFGIGADESIPRAFDKLGDASPFKTKMAALEEERKAIASTLSGVKDANTPVSTVVHALQAQIDAIPPESIRSQSGGDAAVNYLQDRIQRLVKTYSIPQADGSLRLDPKASINFGELDTLVKTLQQDAYNRTDNAAPLLKSGANQINDMVKGLATHAGAENPALARYADIKGQESKIFGAFDSASQNINKSRMMNMIIGGVDDVPTSKASDVGRNAATQSLAAVDEALGTDYTNSIRTGQMQNNIFQAIQSGKAPSGSAGTMTRAIGGYVAGNAVHPGAGIPAAAVAAIGGMPQVGLPAAAALGAGQEAIQQSVINPMEQSLTGASQGVSQAINPAVEAALKNAVPQVAMPNESQQPDDPFAHINF